ncbi:methyl-accepting chemotaxis protein [Halarcobacter anaerophilus]|uniref:Chemotaxis protein n=1 Tax=Halarcobacter anaerophilus TaxID=877500 RepID=A0A4V1LPQ6_9BACT|nr:HAMP domain-containing methyl-accepting chemotaxis protein [Halarcobacter anaerophilus]QDF28305.1 MCP-domain signal transduction protein [Halarcobacter anaerophilus]RXJ62028.1 chemotaxis protein [Halarcobacter anaerophilus]
MLNNFSISLKLKINSALIVLGLLIAGLVVYNSLNSLSNQYKNSAALAKQNDTLNSIFINGLLYNSSSGVVFQNPDSQKAKETMNKAITKVMKSAIEFKKLNSDLYLKFEDKILNFLTTVKPLYEKVQKGNSLEKEDMAASLQAWRDLKFSVTDILKSIKKDAVKSQESYHTFIEESIISIILIFLVILVLILIFNILLSRSIVQPLEILEEAMEKLSTSSEGHAKIDIKSKDETAMIAKNFNKYLDKIEKGREEDSLVIHDVKEVVEDIKKGKLNSRVKTTTSNRAIMELVNTLNSMLHTLHEIIDHALETLDKYKNEDFRSKTSIECEGEIDKLLEGINTLGETISNMLGKSKRRGLQLNESSKDLSDTIDSLNTSSTEAAANLEQTAAALEEITANVKSSTIKVEQMSQLANEVTENAQKGESLASKTASSMDEINNEVAEINEAITVIDQIAFQTNILSLNAAVEAATAGEAGKGFAVVAQEVRNLANRSADAAKEIKDLVEKATLKANEGKTISDNMIQGYNGLSENINRTIELISDISVASKEQQSGIVQINDAINALDQQSQLNATTASKTKEIATSTQHLAKEILDDTNSKEFLGKNEIKIERKEEKNKELPKSKENKNSKKTEQEKIVQAEDDDEWESF